MMKHALGLVLYQHREVCVVVDGPETLMRTKALIGKEVPGLLIIDYRDVDINWEFLAVRPRYGGKFEGFTHKEATILIADHAVVQAVFAGMLEMFYRYDPPVSYGIMQQSKGISHDHQRSSPAVRPDDKDADLCA